MIGANEFIALDRHCNTAFVSGSLAGRDKYLDQVQAMGFEVDGIRVLATKAELEVAFAAQRNAS